MRHAGYKGDDRNVLMELADHVASVVEISLDGRVRTDHDFDAFISAIVARLARTGGTQPIPKEHTQAAGTEGWIHLPSGGLGEGLW